MEKIPKLINLPNKLNFDNFTESAISKNSNSKSKLYETKDKPHKIIRIESCKELKEKHNNMDIHKLVNEATRLYKELDEKYGIPSPVDFLISTNTKKEDVVCSITDKINGISFAEAERTESFSIKINKLYASIAKYFTDKFDEGGLYIWDINGASQYIYMAKNREILKIKSI